MDTERVKITYLYFIAMLFILSVFKYYQFFSFSSFISSALYCYMTDFLLAKYLLARH